MSVLTRAVAVGTALAAITFAFTLASVREVCFAMVLSGAATIKDFFAPVKPTAAEPKLWIP